MTTDKRSVYDKLSAGEYTNQAPYPRSPAQVALATSRGQNVPETGNEDWHAGREAWNRETHRLEEQFRADALEEVGLTGHPKADKVYALAWEHGHAAGLSDVMIYLVDFASLVLED